MIRDHIRSHLRDHISSILDKYGGDAYTFLWKWISSLDSDKGGMVGSILRDSAASYVDSAGVLQIADGDESPFSHASVEDETGATEMRGSFVDAQAWFHDAGGLIAAYTDTGNLLIIDDTAAKGYGYIGEVGTGEELAAALVEDDMADDSTGDWSAADCTVAFDTDHYEITRTAGTQSFYQDSLTFTDGALHKAVFTIKDGTAADVVVNLAVGDTFYGGEVLNEAVTTTAVWVTHTFYFTATSGTDSLSFQSDFAANNYELKGFTINEVTEPAATAVKIYKDYDLTTAGWNALDTGIDYNGISLFDVYRNNMFEYPNLLSGWDFTSGWITLGTAVADDANSFTGTAGMSYQDIFITGNSYKITFNRTTTATECQVWTSDVNGRTLIGGDGTHEFVADRENLYIRNADTGTTDVSLLEVAQTAGGAQPRFEATGLLNEGEGTNWCLQSNDMTEAVWTATNITPLKDVTGVDGVTNSASRLTATAGNGTIIQSINTLASATHAYSVWLKRITGTGDIDLTDDNGANWTTKVLTSAWTRFFVTRSQTDPIVGIRIVTSGDVIAAQFNQVEESQAYITSAIPTTTIPVTRTADTQKVAMSTAFKNMLGNVADSPFTMVVEWTPKFSYGDTDVNENVIAVRDAAVGVFYTNKFGTMRAYDGSELSEVDPNYTANTTYIFALRVFLDTTMKFEVGEKHGGTWTWDATPAAYDSSFNPSTDLLIGYLNQYPFNIKNLTFWDTAKTQAWIENKY